MRHRSIFRSALCTLSFLLGLGCFGVGCNAEKPTSPSQVKTLLAVPAKPASGEAATKAKKTMPIAAAAKKKNFAALGSPKKLGDTTDGPGAKLFRESEAKRLLDHYNAAAVRYAEDMAVASTPEQKEMLTRRQPSAAAVRPTAVVMGRLIAEEPADAPARDLLVFLAKFVDVPVVQTALSKLTVEASDGSSVPFDTMALLLEHHADDPKMITACRRLPRGGETDGFLKAVFSKSYNPEVRWSSGAQLISSLRRNGRKDEMMEIVNAMAEDRYLEGVQVGGDSTARGWALAMLREVRTLGVGNVLPDVSGEKLKGGMAQIADYRGKVVVLDVWTTWCGPCRAMIPHNTELVERLKDEPFAFINVSCDAKRETLEEFMEDTEMPWEHWWVGSRSEFAKTLNIRAYPQIIVLDQKGVIRYKNIKGEELDEAVDTLLAEGQ